MEWTEERLRAEFLLPQIEEDQHLEYKGAGALTKDKIEEITKDVSAFANADGGTLIYGIAETKGKPSRPEKLEPIDGSKVSQEWLEHITKTIAPPIPELEIVPIAIPSADIRYGYVYLVKVPRSSTAHQARNHKYYRRYNFENQSMPDHEVRDVMHRGNTPIVEPHFAVSSPTPDFGTTRSQTLLVSVENKGPVAVRHLKLGFTFRNLDDLPFSVTVTGTKRDEIHRANRRIVKIFGEHSQEFATTFTMEWRIAYRSTVVLFPQDTVEFSTHGLWFLASEEILSLVRPYLEKHEWTLWADNMPPKRGLLPLDDLITYGGRKPSHH